MNRLLALQVKQPDLVGSFQQGQQHKQRNRLMGAQLENTELQNEALRGESERRQQAIKRKAEINLVGHLVEALGQTDNLEEKAQLYTQALEVGDRMKLDMADLPREYKPEFEQMLRIQSGAKDFEFKEPKAEAKTNIEKLQNYLGRLPEDDPRRASVLAAIQKATAPSKGVNVTTNVGGEPPYKIPTGFMLKDTSDPSQGITPIPGGAKDRLSGESAGKAQMLRTAQKAAKNIRSLIFDEDGTPNWTSISNASFGVPKTKGRELRTKMEFGIQAITRIETGAAMPKEEVENTRERFQPSMFDSPETIQLKFEMFNDFIGGTLKLLDPSGRFNHDRFQAEFESRGGVSELPEGVTEADITTTMGIHNMTREQVLEGLNNGSR